MARAGSYCSYKRATFVVCSINLLAALYLLHSLYSFLFIFSSSANGFASHKYSKVQIRKMEESMRIRRESEPVDLKRVVEEINEKFLSREERVSELSHPVKFEISEEIQERLKGLGHANVSEQRASVETWRKEKLEETKQLIMNNTTANSTKPIKEALTLQRVLETDWSLLLEDIGLWLPQEIVHKESNEKPDNEQELEDEIIPGRRIPPECHPEVHTDYDGAAVRWGLTHHKESAADCCQACFDQAKRAKRGEMKCNIWVYCPSETGCFSPDIYEHKHQECWLKQAGKPRLNFKDMYSESYRKSHPAAPVAVPWISGVISS